MVYICSNNSLRAHGLIDDGKSSGTNSFRDALGILVREDLGMIWMVADYRLKAFSIAPLEYYGTSIRHRHSSNEGMTRDLVRFDRRGI
jgi:hypothetical protein